MDTVSVFMNAFLAHPLSYIGGILSLLAAVGFVICLWGFVEYLMALNGNDAEKSHGSVSMVRGVTWIIIMFIAWEVLRLLAGYFS